MIDKEVVLKAWEVYQGLIQALGESCWKIRSIFYTTSSAMIAYGFVHSISFLYVVVAVLSIIFFVLEAGYKQIQNQYIVKSAEIERTLNDLLVDEPHPFIAERGIKTAIKTPTRRGYIRLLRFRNFLFWGPYFLVLVCALLLAWCHAGIKKPSDECQKATHSNEAAP
jgi:hypothetical protein